MTQDTLSFFQALLLNAWRLLTSWYIPGTNVTPGALIVGLFVVSILFKFLNRVIFNGGSNDSNEKE